MPQSDLLSICHQSSREATPDSAEKASFDMKSQIWSDITQEYIMDKVLVHIHFHFKKAKQC